MSRIEKLLTQLCPTGVEFKTLGEVGQLVRGNGMPKTDFTDHGVGAIHYGQIYTYYGTWATKTISTVAPETAARLAKVDTGDIIITNTSENLEDVGKAVAWLGQDQVVTGGHATVFKHHQDPKFVAYWLQSPSFQVQKKKLATGTKVIDVSAKSLATIRIPVPPVEVQREIVRVLDSFGGLEAALREELEARRRQYAHYKNLILHTAEDVPRVKVGDVCRVFGGHPFESKYFNPDGNGLPVVRIRDINTGFSGTYYSGPYDDRYLVHDGDILIGMDGDFRSIRWAQGEAVLNQRVSRLQDFESLADPGFVFYVVREAILAIQATTQASTVKHISSKQIANIMLPLPPLEDQQRLASALDQFDALINDPVFGVPAELAARRKQYEYYRDRLLTFVEATA